ncbi:MAG: biopolymer transporter ExbD [Thermodesulfobacterium sp.]|jgi:biopolymer transport protein TolR|nr:biopolymer transporter ExbD [Thermodesulfobacterium sp.]
MKLVREPQAEINIIPLVDIVLVILIIFMITAPLMTAGIEVNLPQTKDSPLSRQEAEPLRITIFKDGTIKVSGEVMSLNKLSAWLEEAKKRGVIKEVQIEADREANYGLVAKVLSEVKRAGFTQVGLLTIPE